MAVRLVAEHGRAEFIGRPPGRREQGPRRTARRFPRSLWPDGSRRARARVPEGQRCRKSRFLETGVPKP